MNKPLTIIDLFSGVGGLSYGFSKNSNFSVIAANEILPDMAKAYSLNHPNVKMYNCNIKEFTYTKLKNDLELEDGDIDIIIGGPPCQAYSTIGKRKEGDPRGKLFKEYSRILKEVSPKLFIFENVKGLLSIDKGRLFKNILSEFEAIGYSVNFKILNAAEFGTPQIRERVIIVGAKGVNFNFPNPTHGEGLLPFVTVKDALSDLPLIKSGESSDKYLTEPLSEYQKEMRRYSKLLNDHTSAKNNEKLIKIMEALPDGGTPKDIPEHLRPKSGFGNTYSKLWWNKPSTTITRNLGTPSSSRCVHPLAPRALTTREGARLQGFPDDYKFYGSRSNKNLQIGNAVPTQLSKALANSVLEAFKLT